MCIKSFYTVLDEGLRKKKKEIREHKLNEMGVLVFFRDPYNANVGVFKVSEVS